MEHNSGHLKHETMRKQIEQDGFQQ